MQESIGREMQEAPMVEASGVEAERLADITSIHQDLVFCIEVVKRLEQLLSSEPRDDVLITALWSAALVSYCRCFASGKRYGLAETVFDGLAGDPVGVHRYYRKMRDKHIAHSVNPFEQVMIGLVLSPPGSDPGVTGVSSLSMRLVGFNLDDTIQLGMLASHALKFVQAAAKQQQTKVLEAAAREPIETLYSRPRVQLVAPGSEQVAQARS